jgi:hypothetical protein
MNLHKPAAGAGNRCGNPGNQDREDRHKFLGVHIGSQFGSQLNIVVRMLVSFFALEGEYLIIANRQ